MDPHGRPCFFESILSTWSIQCRFVPQTLQNLRCQNSEYSKIVPRQLPEISKKRDRHKFML